MSDDFSSAHFVSWFRSVAPYVNLFRGKTFLIAFGGKAIAGPLARTLALVRRIERAQQTLRARHNAATTTRIEVFEHRLRALRDRLEREHIDVHDLTIDLTASLGARFVLRELAIAVVMVPISLWGRLTHVVPLRITRYLALRNVRALDEPPMRTFLVGLVLVLASYIVLTTLVGLAVGPWWALAFFATLIPSASHDLRYSDRVRRVLSRARAYRRFRRDPTLRAALLSDADWLRTEAGALEVLSTEY